jgi:RNA polymerase sigma-70 factor, ECF subfamily
MRLAAELQTRRGAPSAAAAAAVVLAFRADPRFPGVVTAEPPGARVTAGAAVSPGTVAPDTVLPDTVLPDTALPDTALPDTASQAWVTRLGCPGPQRDAAVTELHGLLLRVARFEIARRRTAFPRLGGADLDDLAWQSADDAVISILRRLGDFRGESRFTTWACKFAIVEAGIKVRRHAWRGREIPVAAQFWPEVADAAPSPQQHAEARDLLWALGEEIERLTGRQREVFVAVALNDVPIDVLAERLNTTRGAIYKTLHDARRKLRVALAARGLGVDKGRQP